MITVRKSVTLDEVFNLFLLMVADIGNDQILIGRQTEISIMDLSDFATLSSAGNRIRLSHVRFG